MDTVYDKKISVKAYRLTVFLDVNTKEDYGIYTVLVTNSIDQGNFSVLLKSAGKIIIMLNIHMNIVCVFWEELASYLRLALPTQEYGSRFSLVSLIDSV